MGRRKGSTVSRIVCPICGSSDNVKRIRLPFMCTHCYKLLRRRYTLAELVNSWNGDMDKFNKLTKNPKQLAKIFREEILPPIFKMLGVEDGLVKRRTLHWACEFEYQEMRNDGKTEPVRTAQWVGMRRMKLARVRKRSAFQEMKRDEEHELQRLLPGDTPRIKGGIRE